MFGNPQVNKSFKERLKDTGYLLKNSFIVVGKDKDIKTPTIKMALLALIRTFLFFFGVGLLIFGVLGGGILLFISLCMWIYQFFYDTRRKAEQSWIVYNTICGKDISYQDARDHIQSEKGKLRFISFVDLLMKYAASQKNNRKGIIGMLISLFLSALIEVWDLVSNFALPSMVIEKKKLKEVVPELKALRNNVPATLMGVFGIDFVGKAVGSLLFGLFFIALIFGVGIGWVVGLLTTATVLTIGTFSFSWVPVFMVIALFILFASVYARIIGSLKVIYFTIFYTSITRPMDIDKSMRDQLTNYLLFKGMDEKVPLIQTKTEAATREKMSADIDPKHKDLIAQLVDYFHTYTAQGRSVDEVKAFLLEKGVAKKDLDEAIILL